MSTSPGPNLLNQLINRQINYKMGSMFPPMLFRERFKVAKNLFKTDLIGHYGCVNAIEFSNGGKYLVSGGDDKRVLLWDVEKALAGYSSPISMEKEHQSNIFCLGFDKINSKIFSGGNDELVIVHDFETKKVVDVFIHQKPVYGLSVDPTCDSILATASEDGKITIYDQRKSAAVQVFGKFGGSRQASFHAVQFHPFDGNFLVTANTRKGAAFWDIRSTSKPLIQYGGEENQKSCMSVRFNSNGTLVLALRRRLPPILYNTNSEAPICQFYHSDYYNSCTMKSCCFAGEDDEFVLSGSDDFNLYVWRVGDVDLEQSHQWIEKTQMILYGHRSIVNQVRYNSEKCILASSGVEKIVKIWSPFQQKGWTGGLTEEACCSDNPREVFTHDAYLSLASANMSHDYSTQNTQEDSRMMAFFDSLIQQEIEQWSTSNYSSDSCQFSNDSSEGRSTRHSSTDDSDDDVNINSFFSNSRNHNRRGSATNVKPQRNKYTNRIAYLIATKRNTLRRLALKGASNSRRRQNILKTKKKIHHHRNNGTQQGVRTSRSGNSQKRPGRFTSSMSFRNRNGSTNSNVENSDVKLMRQKRYDAIFRTLRRKHRNRRHIDPSDTSSDDDDIDVSFNYEPSRSTNIAIPSTSTGITSSGRDIIIRLRQQEQLLDSEYYDDDDDDDHDANTSSLNIQNSIQNNINNVNNNNQHNNHNVLNGHTNNIANNSANNLNRNSARNSTLESEVEASTSTIETDPEDRQNNNHCNNNTDMLDNNIDNNQHLVTEIITTDEDLVTTNPLTFNINNLADDNSSDNNENSNKNFNLIIKKITRKRQATSDTSSVDINEASTSFRSSIKQKNHINKSNVKNSNIDGYKKSNNNNYDIYSSHSNSRLSNSDYLDDSSTNSFDGKNENLDCCDTTKVNNKNKTNADANNFSIVGKTSTSNFEYRKRRKISDSLEPNSVVSTSHNKCNNSSSSNQNENDPFKYIDDKQDSIDSDDGIEKDNVDDIDKYIMQYNKSSCSNQNDVVADNSNQESLKSDNINLNGFTSKNFIPVTPDSGIKINPGCSSVTSSSSPISNSNRKIFNLNCNNYQNNNEVDVNLHNVNRNENNSSSCTNDCNSNSDKFSIKLFHQKVNRVRRNYRNNFGEDSESD